MERQSEPYNFFITPLQQKISALRKWKIFNKHRSTSTEPKESTRRPKKFPPGCLSTPVPRRNMSSQPNSIPLRPRMTFPSHRDPMTMNNHRNLNEVEQNQRYEEIKANSGVIEIGGVRYEGVKVEELFLIGELGSGTCGNVTKRRFHNHSIAVKEMRNTDDHEEKKRVYMDLYVIRKSNDCEYIVKCHGYIITYDHLYICMELMATCLEKLMAKLKSGLPEEIIGKVTVSVVKALNYLKETHQIMHRDVKPSNILIDWLGNIKLCDFGISGQLIDSKASTMSTGCAAYLAPERINRTPDYDVRADIWSLGITLVHLARGKYPYECNSPFEVMLKIREESPPLLRPNEGFSAQFCDFVDKCLQKNPENRPKYHKLAEHEFFQIHENSEVDVAEWYASVDGEI
uniref:mitogen-activated protein kinase kinase n=1 Tax=Acrobeloides nanus TaxID=290746 RepID=A0A914DR37_9BILA